MAGLGNLIQNFAINMIRNNPNIANDPKSQQMIDVIMSGDSQRGQEIAQNICNSYGVTPAQAIEQGRKFFGI